MDTGLQGQRQKELLKRSFNELRKQVPKLQQSASRQSMRQVGRRRRADDISVDSELTLKKTEQDPSLEKGKSQDESFKKPIS
jgi:hypothetical protein